MIKKIKVLLYGQRKQGEKVRNKVHFKTTVPPNRIDFFEWAKQHRVGILASKEVFY